MSSPTLQPKSSILITGGSGSLGSKIALQIARSQPGIHHLILTARSLTDQRTINTSSALKSLNASFEFQVLDLSSFDSIHMVTSTLKDRIANNEIPSFAGGGLILSAAMNTFAKDNRTKDGWKDMYQVNILSPVLLLRELLPALNNSLIINITSYAHTMAPINYFLNEIKTTFTGNPVQGNLGLGEAMKRYGACKQWMIMAIYALQRRLDTKPNSTTHLLSIDPGGMSGDSNLGLNHWAIKSLLAVLGALRPVIKRVKKDAINPPEVPARVIAGLFEEGRGGLGGKYFVLDDEGVSSKGSLDVKGQEEVWGRISRDLGLEVEI